MVFTGSTAKQFTIGTVYDTIGPYTQLTTPVYATAPIVDSVLRGDVILVGSGDLALGGRGAMQGRVDHAPLRLSAPTTKPDSHLPAAIRRIASSRRCARRRCM
jgi:D-alanyl-D-alanine carboxypeptidase